MSPDTMSDGHNAYHSGQSSPPMGSMARSGYDVARTQKETHERIMQQQREGNRSAPSTYEGPGFFESAPPVVLLFGFIGAFVSGAWQPWGMHWATAVFFGFVVGGMGAGVLSGFRTGRIVLWIVGLGFAALVGIGIYLA
jgi:hypothetical protein